MKKILFSLVALMLTLGLILGMGSCSEDQTESIVTPAPDKELPADAGVIARTTLDDGSVRLSVSEIARAESYRWYKEGEEIQHSEARTCVVYESGRYTVAGVNAHGEGALSPVAEIKIISEPALSIRVHSDRVTAWSVLFDILPEDSESYYYYNIISKERWEQTSLQTLQNEVEESIRKLAEMAETSYEEALQSMLVSGDLINQYDGAGFRGETEYYIYAFYWYPEGPSQRVTLSPFTTPAPVDSSETLSLSFVDVEPYSMTVVCDPSPGVVDYYFVFDEKAKVDAMLNALEDENAFRSYQAMNLGTHHSDLQHIQRQGLKPENTYTALVMAIDEAGNRFVSRADQATPSVEQEEPIDSELFEKLLGEWHGEQVINDPYSGAYTSEFVVRIVDRVAGVEEDFRARNQLVAEVDGWNSIAYYGVAALEKEFEGLETHADPVEAYGPKWILQVGENDTVTLDGRARHSVIGWMFMGDCFMTSANAEQAMVYTSHDLQVSVSADYSTLTISSPEELTGCYPSLSYQFEGFGWMAYFYGGSAIVLSRQ